MSKVTYNGITVDESDPGAVAGACHGVARSGMWPCVEKHARERDGKCMYCGATEHLQVHHLLPFHIHPELELNPDNLITLCMVPGVECHYHHGHLDPIRHVANWHSFNPTIQAECDQRNGSAPR